MGIIFKTLEIYKMKHLQQRELLETSKRGDDMITLKCFKKVTLAAAQWMDSWSKSGSLEAS